MSKQEWVSCDFSHIKLHGVFRYKNDFWTKINGFFAKLTKFNNNNDAYYSYAQLFKDFNKKLATFPNQLIFSQRDNFPQ